MVTNLSKTYQPGSVSFTFGFRRTALAKLENDAVRAHRFLLVAAEQFLQAAEVSFGSTEVELPIGRPGYQAVLVFYSIIRLADTQEEGTRGKCIQFQFQSQNGQKQNTTKSEFERDTISGGFNYTIKTHGAGE